MKARLADLPNGLINITVNSNGFLLQKNHFEVAKYLKRKSDILITRPDKGAGVVILNLSDYIAKMATILDDATKFLKIGGLSFDDTYKKLSSRNGFLNSSRKNLSLEKSKS